MTQLWNWRESTGSCCAEGFPSQAEAEAWLAESWEDLLDSGIGAVSLYEEERYVYGPMDLEPLS